QVSDGTGGVQYFERGDSPVPIFATDERLADHPEEVDRELHANLLLLVLREYVNNPIHGLQGIDGVQGGKHQVPSFGGGNRKVDRFKIAHFADQNHVWVLAKHVL